MSRRWSPYNYAFDNPIRYIDPDGMLTYDWAKGQYTDDEGAKVNNDDSMAQINAMSENI